MRAISTAIICAALLAIAGCGDDDSATPTTTPTSGPLVSYEKSGGVAAVLERLTVYRDATATVRVGFTEPVERTFVLGPDELLQLSEELEAADLEAVDPSDPNLCADCFVFKVRYGDEEIEFAEIDEPPESVATVISHLGSLVEDHYPETAPGAP